MDETGQPWPIANYSLGNPQAFDIVWDQKSHTLFVQSMNAWSFANMGIRLVGLNTPIMLNLVSVQGDIDYRIDFTLPHRGPLAKDLPQGRGSTIIADQTLFPYLDGTPPAYAVALVVDPVYAQAWMEGDWMILRTKDLLISPSWTAQTMSSDGTKVYKLRPANTVVISRDGAARTIQIKGC
jgi:intracellular multiplication protein IcmK